MTPEFPTENFSSPTNVSKSVTNASWPRPLALAQRIGVLSKNKVSGDGLWPPPAWMPQCCLSALWCCPAYSTQRLSWGKRIVYILLCAAVWNYEAPVVVPCVIRSIHWIFNNEVFSPCWTANTSTGLLRHKKQLRRNCWHQSLNHPVKVGRP